MTTRGEMELRVKLDTDTDTDRQWSKARAPILARGVCLAGLISVCCWLHGDSGIWYPLLIMIRAHLYFILSQRPYEPHAFAWHERVFRPLSWLRLTGKLLELLWRNHNLIVLGSVVTLIHESLRLWQQWASTPLGGGSETLTQGSPKSIGKTQLFTLQFIAKAQLQLWSSNENSFMMGGGCYHSMRNCI